MRMVSITRGVQGVYARMILIRYKYFYLHKQNTFLTIRIFIFDYKFYKKDNSWKFRILTN